MGKVLFFVYVCLSFIAGLLLLFRLPPVFFARFITVSPFKIRHIFLTSIHSPNMAASLINGQAFVQILLTIIV